MSKTIKATNLGAIHELSVALQEYGVTVLSGPNGSGKSTLLQAASSLVSGKGKLPLRDRARKGAVEGFGAKITLGAATRHSGECEVLHLEGKFDLASLVDPGLKSPEAADKRRIKALVSLTGVDADPSVFAKDEAFVDYSAVVSPETESCDDLVEMAARLKRDYEQRARSMEEQAENEEGHASGLEQSIEGVDLKGEADPEQLQEDYDRARAEVVELRERQRSAEHAQEQREKAEASLRELEDKYDGPAAATAASAAEAAQQKVERLRDELQKAEADMDDAFGELQRAKDHEEAVQTCRRIIDAQVSKPPTKQAHEEAEKRWQQAKQALENGAMLRKAREAKDHAHLHRKRGQEYREKAYRYRQAAKSTDGVLSQVIQCDRLRIDSTDGDSRLVVDHPKRGQGVPFHELSEGERWAIAIDLGADQVGENGLLVIPQEAWEGLDVYTRPKIHERAKARKVHILTAEATRKAEDGETMQAKPYEETISQ